MKKLHLFSMVCLLTLLVISLASCGKEEYDTNPRGNGNSDGEYVDLGLPSGTKWKTSNETKEDGCEFFQSWKGMNHEDYCWGFSIRLVKNE